MEDMTDYADLCKRLRGPDGRAEPLCDEAADAIEALQADNAHWQDRALGMQTERNALRAELQNIVNADPRTWQPDVRDQFQQWAQSRARAALAAQEKP